MGSVWASSPHCVWGHGPAHTSAVFTHGLCWSQCWFNARPRERMARKTTLALPNRSLLRSQQGPSQRAALPGHQPLGVSEPPLDLNFPTSSQPKKFPSEKSILAYIMSFSQQLLRPSKDVLRFLRKRGSQKAAGGVGLWSQCPASGAEEFTALSVLTLYFSPQPCESSVLCQRRSRTREQSAFPSTAGCCFSRFPISGPAGPGGRGRAVPGARGTGAAIVLPGRTNRRRPRDSGTDGPQTLPGQCALLHSP